PDVVTAGSIGVPVFGPTPSSGIWDLGGESRLTTAMANALFDIGGNEGVGFSVGVGAGRAWLDSFLTTSPTQAFVDDSDSAWAYQAIAQARLPITEGAELGLKYKYLNTNQFDMVDSIGRSYETELAVHS